ncbi:hypothetical protein [Halorarum salinum]|uniref:Uncharacterized protein n=1 Tax=Halorarum salinum TaxID=2743089 RepID=A0A7D5QCK5_9EURY|nr:hypothetical protein [Halobaculum salinum]QLG63139.1 hypothetical protein HUG12_15925 [Halobaculum salinum]
MSDPDPEAVKAALRRLVSGERRNRDVPPESTVAGADSSLTNVRAAADVADRGGFAAVEAAVTAAERRGDGATARRGRAVLRTVSAYRAAAADHFHAGHVGLMGGEQVPSDETS